MSKLIKDELKEKYSTELYEVTVSVGDAEADNQKEYSFFFKKPSPADFGRFVKDSGQKTITAMTNLISSTIVEEQKEEFAFATVEFPGIVVPVASELLKLLGVTADAIVKKL